MLTQCYSLDADTSSAMRRNRAARTASSGRAIAAATRVSSRSKAQGRRDHGQQQPPPPPPPGRPERVLPFTPVNRLRRRCRCMETQIVGQTMHRRCRVPPSRPLPLALLSSASSWSPPASWMHISSHRHRFILPISKPPSPPLRTPSWMTHFGSRRCLASYGRARRCDTPTLPYTRSSSPKDRPLYTQLIATTLTITNTTTTSHRTRTGGQRQGRGSSMAHERPPITTAAR